MMIFHSYVSLPEGKRSALEMCPSTSLKNILRPSLGTSKKGSSPRAYQILQTDRGRKGCRTIHWNPCSFSICKASKAYGSRKIAAGKSKTTSWVYKVVEHHNLQLARDLPQRFRHEVN
jgi:hypothetical protein